MEWSSEKQGDKSAVPSELSATQALKLGAAAWEDGSPLRWTIWLPTEANLLGRGRVAVDALLPGPQPHTKQLLLVFPLKLFDPDDDDKVGIRFF